MTLELETGCVIANAGPVPLFRGISSLFSQVLGHDERFGVTHISILRAEETFEVEVIHLPILTSVLHQGVVERSLDRHRVSTWAREMIQSWRQLHSDGRAGVFNIPVWKVRRNAWKTVRKGRTKSTLRSHLIETAFPTLDQNNEWKKVVAYSVQMENR